MLGLMISTVCPKVSRDRDLFKHRLEDLWPPQHALGDTCPCHSSSQVCIRLLLQFLNDFRYLKILISVSRTPKYIYETTFKTGELSHAPGPGGSGPAWKVNLGGVEDRREGQKQVDIKFPPWTEGLSVLPKTSVPWGAGAVGEGAEHLNWVWGAGG